MVFIPRANAGDRPAMVVELKYNQSADSAINQIKERRYQGALSGYSDKILLVGVNYDADGEDKKKHTCVIEEWCDQPQIQNKPMGVFCKRERNA